MADVNTVSCDICQTIKFKVNHWWKGYLLDNTESKSIGVIIVPLDIQILLRPGVGRQALPKPDKHFCGIEHAIRWTQQVLQDVSITAITAPPQVSGNSPQEPTK